MNLEQLLGFVRIILGAVGAILIKKGATDDQTWGYVVGGLLAVVSLGWAWYHHSAEQQQARADTLALNPIAPTTVVAHDARVLNPLSGNPPPKEP